LSTQFGDGAPHDRPHNDRVSAVDDDNEKTDRPSARGRGSAAKDKAKAVFTDRPANDTGSDRSDRTDRTGTADRPAVDDKSVINDEPPGDRTVTDRPARSDAGSRQDTATARDRDTAADPAMGARTDAAGTGRTPGADDTPTGRTPDAEDGRKPLFGEREAEEFHSRWREVAASFVDEPRTAVREAETLVDKLMDELKAHLEEQKRSLLGERTDTEELRIALRRYRSLADQILAV
jgi:hypothetical protein